MWIFLRDNINESLLSYLKKHFIVYTILFILKNNI